MKAIVGEQVHEVNYYDGLFIDTRCNMRIFGTEGREYRLVSREWKEHQPLPEIETTCPVCLSLPEHSPIKGITVYRDGCREGQPLSQ